MREQTPSPVACSRTVQRRLRWFFSVAVVATAAGFSVAIPRAAHAITANDVEIVYPSPGMQVVKGTNVNIFIVAKNAIGSNKVKAELDYSLGDVTDLGSWTAADVSIIDIQSSNIQKTWKANDGSSVEKFGLPTANNGYLKFRFTDNSGSSVIVGTQVNLVDAIQFKNSMWIGASTGVCKDGSAQAGVACQTDIDCCTNPNDQTSCDTVKDICGGDAPGWVSVSCRNDYPSDNGVTQCNAPSTYAVTLAKDPLSTSISLMNNAWAGVAAGSGDLSSAGFFTWNKKYCDASASATYCTSAKNFRTPCSISNFNTCDGTTDSCSTWFYGACASDAECGSGSCILAGSIPPNSDPEQWSTNSVMNAYYTTQETASKRYPSQLAGWGRFIAPGFTADNGWIHLRGVEAPTRFCDGGSNDGNACTNGGQCPGGSCPNNTSYSNVATGAYQQCRDCSSGDSPALCNICTSVQVTPLTKKNYSCNSCHTCTTDLVTGLTSCNACDSCSTYGISFDEQAKKLVGYGWGGDQASGGLGWVNFDQVSALELLRAWLQTQWGDMFSNQQVQLTTPVNQYNATYIIQANGSITASSQNALTGNTSSLQSGYPTISFPGATNKYINVLGKLDIEGMKTPGPTNRYGTEKTLNNGLNDLENPLSGKIYYNNGALTISTPITFLHGIGTGSGAGTIIVDGDLTINADLNYDSTSGGALTNIPSVAWIVLGNLTVNPAVKNIVGTFFVLGDTAGSSTAVCPTTSGPPILVSGVFSSGTLRPGTYDAQLAASGLIMARCINFQRELADNSAAAEQIIYDGRFIANPPPGLQNLAALLPSVRQVVP